jgi:hypothetical protein
MVGELVGDLVFHGLDLGPQRGQGGDQGQGDLRSGRGPGSGGAARSVVEVAPQSVGVGQVVVADRAQPVAEPDR